MPQIKSSQVALFYFSVTITHRYWNKNSTGITCTPCINDMLTCLQYAYLPKAKLIAKYSGVSVTETVITNSSPGSVVENFQTPFVCHITSYQSH